LRAYVFLVILVALIPIGFFSPFGGLLSYTWVSYFNPHEYTFGFTRRLPVAMLIVIPTLVGFIFTARRKAPPFTLQTVLLALLWLWFGITTVNVHESALFVHHWTDTLQKFEQVSKMLLMAFISLMLVIDFRRLRLWYLVTAGSFALLALKCAVWGILTGGQFKVYGPPQSMLADNNDFGLAMNIALPMFLCLARTEESKWLSRIFWIALPLGMIAVVLTFSRGAMLGLMALLLAWAMKSRHKLVGAVGLALAIGVLLVAAPEAWIARMKTLQTAPSTDASAQSRLRAWTFAGKLAMDHPIFGGGFETFTEQLYARYAVPDTHGPHSIYFQMLAEHGVPGLAIFLLLIASCWVSCGRIARGWQYEDPPYLADYARMTQLSFMTFLVSGAFLGRAYFDLFYQLIVTTIILKSLARAESVQGEDVELTDYEELSPTSAGGREF
jgi:putative inorganic carbon (hco3(-)) transporter